MSSSTEYMEVESHENSTTKTTKSPPAAVDNVIIHPLVLLSVADHYHRVARGTRKRVVGVLLGSCFRGKVDATNSFAVPFEEDSRNPSVFYLDHNYLESMLLMFRKVNAKERVVGFYSSGPQIRPNDLRIHDICQRFGDPCVFCLIDIRPDRTDLPVTAYKVVEQGFSSTHIKTKSSGDKQLQRTFAHVPSAMGAMEAEEVGVEHLLRDINDPTVSTVASLVKGKLSGLATLAEKLEECQNYLESIVANNRAKVSPEIVANLQTIVNLLPNLDSDLVRGMIVKTNDMHMNIYIASLIRSVIALHDLVNNKIRYGDDGFEHGKEDEKKDDAVAAKKGGGEKKGIDKDDAAQKK
ncbi:proteasome regulatory particle subunit [Mayamaea pseudoterrestris]|nr:proteasome regulatory particle subunit [Mayamaea pseudoterrestris]